MRAIATCLVLLLPLLGCSSNQAAVAPAGAAKAGEHQPKVCLLCPEPPRTNCTLCATSNPVLIVSKDGAGSSTVRLCNRGSDATTLELGLSDFHAQGKDGAYPLSSVGRISSEPPNDQVLAGTAPLAANACVNVKVDASGLWQAGFYTAELRNGDTQVARVKALRYQVPFNVKADGPTPDSVTVELTRGSRARIRLRNDDDMKYRFAWTLDLGGDEYSGVADIAARGTTVLSFPPKPDGFNIFESGSCAAARESARSRWRSSRMRACGSCRFRRSAIR